jgi:hypothetical protein
MQYPNVGAPSPQEIYDGLKMIPNTQQGKQMLTNIAQQGKQSGSVEGGIATALLNSYNQADQARQAPPAPQGTVADQVITQAQPPMPQYGANMMGLATPGLEQAGQQQVAQRMATGGIVALAGGGQVPGYADGGSVLGLSPSWGAAMPQVPEAPDVSGAMNDYMSPPPAEATPPAPATEAPSLESRINKISELYGTPPDIAAELISQHEHEQAQRNKMNPLETIASGLAGYLGTYGSGAHRAGAGLAYMLGTMGAQRREEDKSASELEALRVKAAMQPYEIHKDLVNQVLTAQTAHDKQAADAQLKMWEKQYERGTAFGKEQLGGEYGIRGHEISAGATTEAAKTAADSRTKAAELKSGFDHSGLTGASKATIIKGFIDRGYSAERALEEYNKIAAGLTGTSANPSAQQNTGYSGWAPSGLGYGFLSNTPQ